MEKKKLYRKPQNDKKNNAYYPKQFLNTGILESVYYILYKKKQTKKRNFYEFFSSENKTIYGVINLSIFFHFH